MPISLSGSLNLSGSLTTTGTITATTLVVQTITSSISSITGSTNFGSLITDTHKFTGSLNVTGSLSVVTNGTEFQVNASGVNLGNALTDSHVISGSLRINSSTLIVSSSGNVGIGTTPNTTAGITELAIGSSNTNPLISGIRDGVSAFALSSDSAGTLLNERRNLDLRFSSNNTTRLFISASGNVGIGTSSPSYKFHVSNNTNGFISRFTGGTSSDVNVGIFGSTAGAFGSIGTESNHPFNIFTNGTDRMSITSAGVIDIPYGQIKFPATQNPSADANTLDDYEEGTWTPSLGGTTTYVAQVGAYTKIGRFVLATFEVNVSSIGTGSTISIGGLPFTSFSTPTNGMGGMVGYFTGGANSVVMITLRLDLGSTSISVASIASSSTGMNAGLAFFTSGTRILGSITYMTA